MLGRFAPSPTGPLHLGSLRTALVAWLSARVAGSPFLVRIEDLDPQRSRREWEAVQLADLRALGIDWDGPVVRQSERRADHDAALERLRAAGALYPCFCTRAEIRAAASAPHGRVPAGAVGSGSESPARVSEPAALPAGAYPGTCRALSESERARRIAAGRPYALRIDAGGVRIAYRDRLLGETAAVVDDFVVRRADGVPAYQLAVVVDDAAQGVEQVVRGADLADSTPRQILLARLLELPVPEYAHVGLVLGPDGARLAKRHSAVTLAERGEPVAATLAWLAHSLRLALDRASVSCASELLDEFDLDAAPRGPVTLAP
jgi:glutamyl-tRNA synthetase